MATPSKDILAGKWKEIAGMAKEKWGKLTHDEIMTSKGRAEHLAGLVQERYGKTKADATKEVDAFMKKCGCD